jgi:hypothetical protein
VCIAAIVSGLVFGLNAALVRESAAAARSLKTQAQQRGDTVAVFRLAH